MKLEQRNCCAYPYIPMRKDHRIDPTTVVFKRLKAGTALSVPNFDGAVLRPYHKPSRIVRKVSRESRITMVAL